MRDDRILLREDATAIGAVTALSKKAAPRWKSSGTKSGPCVSIFPGREPIPFVRTPRDTTALNRHVTHRNNLTKSDAIRNLILSLPASNGGNPDA
jgi:hypothetical protein